MSKTAPEPKETKSKATTADELSKTIIVRLETKLGFSEADAKNAEKLLAKTDVSSESWETLLARVVDRKEVQS